MPPPRTVELKPVGGLGQKPVEDRLYIRMCRLGGGFPSIREVRNQRGEPRLTPHIIPASFT